MERTFFALERIYEMTRIPVRCFDGAGEKLLFNRRNEAKDDRADSAALGRIVSRLARTAAPGMLESEGASVYGACFDAARNIVVFGPASKATDALRSALSMFIFVSTGELATEFGAAPDKADEGTNDFRMKYALERIDTNKPQYNYDDEVRFFKPIREGDLDAIRQSRSRHPEAFLMERVGKLAKRSIKQYEYMASVAITLASRAAMEGGVDPMTAYFMAETYFQRLENCGDAKAILGLSRQVRFDFAKKVRESAEQRSDNSHVERCKQFVFRHLTKPFTNDDIAKDLAISKPYLCRLFEKETGMGIQHYAVEKRIEAAKTMLRLSSASMADIAARLCFASQSHFGKAFKEKTGLTPKQFKDKHKIIDFDNKPEERTPAGTKAGSPAALRIG